MLNRNLNENLKDYKIRLFSNKENYGISFQKITDLINVETGENKSESTYRRWWAGYKEGYSDAEKKCLDSSEILTKYEEKRIEFEKAKIKLSDQRNEYNRSIREVARFEELKEIISNNVKNLQPYYKEYTLLDYNDSDDIFVALDDIHFGSNINNNWNIYNSDIAKKRLDLYLANIKDIKNTHNPRNCYVCSNGDLISGNIHFNIQVSNKENVVEQIIGVSELISWFLSELCNIFDNVYFSVVPGNHSRLGDKDKSPKNERLDDLIPWYIKARLSNFENIHVIENDVDSTFNIVNIKGLNYLNVHGDLDSFSGVEKIISMINVPIYCVHFGHLHHNAMNCIQRYKLIMSGSLQGMDDFCIQRRIFGKAQQMVCICNEKGIKCYYDIDLQDV